MCTLSLSTLFYSLENHYVLLKQFTILRDMGLEQEKALQQFFHFFWSKLSFILFLYVYDSPLLMMLKEHLWSSSFMRNDTKFNQFG